MIGRFILGVLLSIVGGTLATLGMAVVVPGAAVASVGLLICDRAGDLFRIVWSPRS